MYRQKGMRIVLVAMICSLCCIFTSDVFAQSRRVGDLEKRITSLEKRVRQLEQRLEKALNPAKYSGQKAKKVTSSPKRTGVTFIKSPLRGKLVRKNLKLAGAGEVDDNLALLITFKNESAAGIVSFKGDIIFKDVYADSILSFFAEIEKAIPAGMSNTWFGGIPYDAGNSSHRKLLDTSVDRIKIIVRPEVIVFADGTMKSYKKKK